MNRNSSAKSLSRSSSTTEIQIDPQDLLDFPSEINPRNVTEHYPKIFAKYGTIPFPLYKRAALELVLSCPLGTASFMSFLQSEFNAENMKCLLETASLKDFIQHAQLKQKTGKTGYDRNYASAGPGNATALGFITFMESRIEEAEEELNSNASFLDIVCNKVKQFKKDYISDDAPLEVNLSSKVKERIIIALDKVIEIYDSSQKSDYDEVAQELVEKILETLTILSEELFVNLLDPFTRYKEDATFYQLHTTYMSIKMNEYTDAMKDIARSGKESVVLNNLINWTQSMGSSSRHPLTVSVSLLESMSKAFSATEVWEKTESGDIILNYEFLNSKGCDWSKVKQYCCELQTVDLSVLHSDEEKLAFFINTYNILMIHACVHSQGFPENPAKKEAIWRNCKYNIGGLEYSLVDICNGILFGNRPHWFFGNIMKKNDQRLTFAPSKLYPEVVFALCTTNEQSPEIDILKPESVFSQLEALKNNYMKTQVFINPGAHTVEIPSFLKDKLELLLACKCQQVKVKNEKQFWFDYVATTHPLLSEPVKKDLISGNFKFKWIAEDGKSCLERCVFYNAEDKKQEILKSLENQQPKGPKRARGITLFRSKKIKSQKDLNKTCKAGKCIIM